MNRFAQFGKSLAIATLMVVPLSLMLSMPVNAKPTLEERADDDWYFNIALFGVSQSKGGKVDSRGLNMGGALGARLSPTLAIEAIFQGIFGGMGDYSAGSKYVLAGVNWAFLPNLSIHGSLGRRVIENNDGYSGISITEPRQDCEEVTRVIVNDWGAKIGLSSDWQNGRFTWHVDWVSIYQPLIFESVICILGGYCDD
jgi:hypothetical protein